MMASRGTEQVSTTVLGRRDSRDGDATTAQGRFGTYRATDGSDGAPVAFDFERPHACLVVGKRGSGKSHTLGVIVEGLAGTAGVAPIVLDPMGELTGLGEVGLDVRTSPRVRADSVPPPAWPALVGLDPAGPAGTLVWQVADAVGSLAEMRERVADVDATATARRGARNHLRLAASWDVFDPAAPRARAFVEDEGTVLDLSGVASAPANAICRAIAADLYRWLTTATGPPPMLPWLVLDEAHAFFDGIAGDALRTVLTRGRTPGISLVAATQRPGALPDVAHSQADLLVAHRLTANPDVSALEAATPTYLAGTLRDRLPRERGCAVVVDDATESVHGVRIRQRRSSHGGASPRASESATADAMASRQHQSTASTGTETTE